MTQNINNVNIPDSRYRSVELTTAQFSQFKSWLKKQLTMGRAAETLGVNRNTIYRISATGSCNTDTYQKILTVINA